mmetsp:Transcript_3638/g.5607  ORF Transcript_3638/g.5607 Transcript_3638/m.5607 type:complete len:81 (-) Transcript_3638:112-354(-)
MRLTISHRLDQVDPAEDILVLVWLIVSFCPTFATPISPFILVLLSTATSLPSNGELDALDVVRALNHHFLMSVSLQWLLL